ncbi:exported alanine and valine rich protein [Mycolicibacterium phlei]|nr:hypothetical protein BKG56_22045 [Mycobacteroides chelonae]ORV12003.1 hypothetical protein AWB96_21970 [Mycobacteroides chelonae]VEG17839.1 exported alanine and valine rich protein [Mycolicibacterium phlei]
MWHRPRHGVCQDRWVRLRPALQLLAVLAAIAMAWAPTATAQPERVAPIGHIGETLHFDYGTIGADVTVHNIEPTGVPAGMAPPRGIIWKAYVTIRPTKVPNAYALLMALKLGGISPETGDAYEPQRTDEPDDLNYALRNAPQGSTVSGAVYWDVYRGPVRHIVLRSSQTQVHLAQWDL